MRQAISTKFLGPTDSRGARVKAACEAGSLTAPWDYSLGIEANHAHAARDLAMKLGWAGHWYGGGLSGAGFVFVMAAKGMSDFAIWNDGAGNLVASKAV